MPLKAVLIGPRGTVFKDGKVQPGVLNELVMFIRRMQAKGVHVGLWSQHPVGYRQADRVEPVESYLSRQCGTQVPFYHANYGQLPARRFGGSVNLILQEIGVQPYEVILVGNDREDMLAGVNNNLLLLRPEWYPGETEYGFLVDSVSDMAQFCELFGLRQHPIFWSVDWKDVQVRSMGPFSTMRRPDFAIFGSDARNVAKFGAGNRRFWFLMIVSSLYFSGLLRDVHYLCPFPGHDPDSKSPVQQGLDAFLTTLGKCFRKDYLPDFIIRHQASIKSQTAAAGQKTFLNQLNTLHLNRRPRHYDRDPNQKPIDLRGKCVLVVDDFCTNGRSLDVARAYIEAAGGKAVLFSWLKTISMPYLYMNPAPSLHPFQVNTIATEPNALNFNYTPHIVSNDAPPEIDALLDAYRRWKWPP